MGTLCSRFKSLQIEVFWPMLMLYFLVLVCYTIHKIITKMDKYKFGPQHFAKMPPLMWNFQMYDLTHIFICSSYRHFQLPLYKALWITPLIRFTATITNQPFSQPVGLKVSWILLTLAIFLQFFSFSFLFWGKIIFIIPPRILSQRHIWLSEKIIPKIIT